MQHWSALEAGRVSLDLEEVDLRHLLEEVTADLDTDVTLDIDDDVEELITADGAWLRVLLRQVLANAVMHGGGAIDVTAARGHTKVEINLRDHGEGIADIDDLRRIFKAFFRRDEAEDAGLGLGLTIAQQVVELHRGGLSARNHPEGGLEIRLWLPAPPIRVSEPDRALESAGWDLSGEHPVARGTAPHRGPAKLNAAAPAHAEATATAIPEATAPLLTEATAPAIPEATAPPIPEAAMPSAGEAEASRAVDAPALLDDGEDPYAPF